MGPNQAPTSPGDWGPDRGGFVAEALNLHRIDLDSLERETHLVSYACRYLSDPLRTRFLEEVERFRATRSTVRTALSIWQPHNGS